MENSLYLVLTEEYCDKPVLDIVKEAIDAEVDIVQMREKSKSKKEMLALGAHFRNFCSNVLFIVNDDPHLANELKADGVHLGQEDYRKFSNVREIMKDKIIGLSTHSIEQVEQSNELDVDYIAYGPLFETKTKNYHVGIEDIPRVLQIAKKPVVFIGGISEENASLVIGNGAKNLAVIRAITKAKNVELSVNKLKSTINKQVFLNINGTPQAVSSNNLAELVNEKKYNPKSIIVEYNQSVVVPEDWDKIDLSDSDNIEIVGIFAGG